MSGVNSQDIFGNTPLHLVFKAFAIRESTSEDYISAMRTANIFLDAGADLSLKNADGKTVVDVAKENGFMIIEEPKRRCVIIGH